MEEHTVSQVALDALRLRITKILPQQILSCVEELTDEQLWWRANETSNSVGNLLIHLSGSLRHFIVKTMGGSDYERNRPAEFAERRQLPKAEVVSMFAATIAEVTQVLEAFETKRLLEPTPEPAYNATMLNLLVNVAVHLATHAGQIVYVAKMLQEGAVDEVWMRAHRQP
ncbi:MAG: DUF1572 family protein [Acidobacteria bacterium]|nr:DUF1572 family protein [Acidobacteriota bacterium]